MGRLLGYFARGLVLLAPLAVTIAVLWFVFTSVDGWLGRLVELPPGAGFVVTVALVRWLGADEFGTYSFVWSWVIVIGTASMFGLDRQLIRPRRAGG